MHQPDSIERTLTLHFTQRIYFTRAVFAPENLLLQRILSPAPSPAPTKALLVLDAGLARAFPSLAEQAAAWFSRADSPIRLVRAPLIAEGGEAVKSDSRFVDELLAEIERHGLCRHSYLLAAGGGALLDAAGFAAALAHRGLRHIRLPSTTLSQADGGVGVKNGINAFGKKNFLGTFTPPFAVINDSDFWRLQPPEEKRAGLIEALKVALIRDASFFEELEKAASALAAGESEAMEKAIRHCAELHVRHIAESGDPFEFGSARPLDFGHWAAHKLEQLSHFEISHGAAVALGLALDTLYSRDRGLLSDVEAQRVLTLMQKLGFSLSHPLMGQLNETGNPIVLEGLEEFREHLGGELTVTLLAKIGRGVEVHEIDRGMMGACLRELALWPPISSSGM